MPIKVRSGGAWVQVAGDGADGQDGAGGDSIPVGTIVMYNGDTAPTGWALCDGGGGRPDLRDRFIIGSGNSYNRGTTGGAANMLLGTANLPSHTHTAGNLGASGGNHTHNHSRLNVNTDDTQGSPTGNAGGNEAAGDSFGNNYTTGGTGNHTHTVSGTTGVQGGAMDTAFSILPPYYAITFIIKI